MLGVFLSVLFSFFFLDSFFVAAFWIAAKTRAYTKKGIDSNAEEVLLMRLWGTRLIGGLQQDEQEVIFGQYFLSFPIWCLYMWTRVNSYFEWQKHVMQFLLLSLDQFFGGVVSFIQWRVKVFEGYLRDDLEQGCQQVVLLGAGWDSRAYRLAAEWKAVGAVVYEIDIPELQEAKRTALSEIVDAGVLSAEQLEGVVFVACDLNVDDLGDALKAHGFQSDRRTLVLWEGVTWYLSEGAVRKTLQSLRNVVDEETKLKLVFDYCPAYQMNPKTQSLGFKRLQAMTVKKGTKFSYGMEPAIVEPLLVSEGYRQLEQFDSKRAAQVFMPYPFQNDYDFGRIVLCELRASS